MSFQPVLVRDNIVNFIGKQGATWSCNVTLQQYGTTEPIDLTGYSVRGQIRTSFSSTSKTADLTCIVIDAANGVINIGMAPDDTAVLLACKASVDATNYTSASKTGTYIYDVEIYKDTPTPVVYRALQGYVYVDPEVTKEDIVIV